MNAAGRELVVYRKGKGAHKVGWIEPGVDQQWKTKAFYGRFRDDELRTERYLKALQKAAFRAENLNKNLRIS